MFNKLEKIFFSFCSFKLIRALGFFGVAIAVEHKKILSRKHKTIIDIGANKGQFSLAGRFFCPDAKIFAFEPLPNAVRKFQNIFFKDEKVRIFPVAIGPRKEVKKINVSERDDSSSLLEISENQIRIFPGTKRVCSIEVLVAPLINYIDPSDIERPSLLKIDVQGYEHEVILGISPLLFEKLDLIYCECSFLELYHGQKLADDMVQILYSKKFKFAGVYNIVFDKQGFAIQADFLFKKFNSPS